MEIPADLQTAIAGERHGTGPLSVAERVELNELRITKESRGKLGALNTARLAWLEQREKMKANPTRPAGYRRLRSYPANFSAPKRRAKAKHYTRTETNPELWEQYQQEMADGSGFGAASQFRKGPRNFQEFLKRRTPRANPALPYRHGCRVRVFKSRFGFYIFVKQPGHYDFYSWNAARGPAFEQAVKGNQIIKWTGTDPEIKSVPDNLFAWIKGLFCKGGAKANPSDLYNVEAGKRRFRRTAWTGGNTPSPGWPGPASPGISPSSAPPRVSV